MSNVSPSHGYLALVDISGYTAYVTGTEFEHAQEIVGDLLEFLLTRLRPLLSLVQIEGDAIFAYTPKARVARGETLFELIEDTYSAFKNQLTSIRRHQRCECAACQNVNALDLKFFIHFGEYIEHSIDDHHGLMGYAPQIVRKREWKNAVADSVGWRGYALFTEEALANLELKPDDLEAMKFADESICTYGLNLQARYEAARENQQVVVSADSADAGLRSELDAPPSLAWEWLNDLQKRNQWWESFTRWSKRLRPGGRTGLGAVNHCNHGLGEMLETVLDWRPFEYYTVEMRITPGPPFHVLQTVLLEPLPEGRTAVKVYYRLQDEGLRWLARPVCGVVAAFLGLELRRLKRLLETQ